MKPKFIDYFMKVAELTATLSYAKRLQVGAVIVKGNQTIGTGYNGMPTDWENTCEERRGNVVEIECRVLFAHDGRATPSWTSRSRGHVTRVNSGVRPRDLGATARAEAGRDRGSV